MLNFIFFDFLIRFDQMLDNILGSPIVHGEIENKVKF